MGLADGLVRAGLTDERAPRALEIFTIVAEEIAERFETVDDSDGEVGLAFDLCITGFARLLEDEASSLRPLVVRTLLTATLWGNDYGLADEGPRILLEATTAAERASICEHLEGHLRDIESEYSRAFAGRLLVRLREPSSSADAELEEHRRAGDPAALIVALLELHRPDDAAKVLGTIVDAEELVRLATVFGQRGYGSHGHRWVERAVESAAVSSKPVLLEWLFEHAVVAKDEQARARRAEELFWLGPDGEGWRRLRRSVKGSRRTDIRRQLATEGRHRLLTEIYMIDGLVRAALTQYRQIEERGPEARLLGSELADKLVVKKPRLAATVWLGLALELAESGARVLLEQAVGYLQLGHEALVAAKHPVLAKRHVQAFRDGARGVVVEEFLADADL